MNDHTTPSEPPEDLGNTVDGTRAGDGSAARPPTDEQSPGGPGSEGQGSEGQGSEGQGPGGQEPGEQGSEQGSEPTSGLGHAEHQRAEQKKVYRTPEQPDHALGGTEGTADGS